MLVENVHYSSRAERQLIPADNEHQGSALPTNVPDELNHLNKHCEWNLFLHVGHLMRGSCGGGVKGAWVWWLREAVVAQNAHDLAKKRFNVDATLMKHACETEKQMLLRTRRQQHTCLLPACTTA